MLNSIQLNLIKETAIILAAPSILYPISQLMQNVDNSLINTGVIITLGAIGYCSASKFGNVIENINNNTNHTTIGLLMNNFRNKKSEKTLAEEPLKENTHKIK